MASRTTTNGLYRRPAFQTGPALKELPPPMASEDDLSGSVLTPVKELGRPSAPALTIQNPNQSADLSFKRFRATPGAERRGATSVVANAPVSSGPHAPQTIVSSSAAHTSLSWVASPSPYTFASRTGADFLVGHRRDLSASTPALSTTSRDTEAGSITHLHTDVNYIPAPWRSPSPRDVRQRDLLEALMREIEQTGWERGAGADSDTYKWSAGTGYGGVSVLPRV
ncbi:hypothetical protein EXIGLDRAFT_779029 [Exidia glandulosa HHB12029]|uniref:Uncharacterized protein n=1 Tax=Exidia glandulosa HHB12029 TaxID=1314781 RepID=A0A165C916_EXIGL|nr:hypothetical protein EXIGLDRAFT_779029 [Exidia glandulosa HHB12029]